MSGYGKTDNFKWYYNEEEAQRMHNAIAQTANLTDEELAQAADVSLEQVRHFRKEQKRKIMDRVAAEEDELHRPPTVGRQDNAHKYTVKEALEMVEKARLERDEWGSGTGF